jgi:hypothetical protein
MLTRLTVVGVLVLLTVGFLSTLVIEGSNPMTLGPLGLPQKTLAAFAHRTAPWTGWFSPINVMDMKRQLSSSPSV